MRTHRAHESKWPVGLVPAEGAQQAVGENPDNCVNPGENPARQDSSGENPQQRQ